MLNAFLKEGLGIVYVNGELPEICYDIVVIVEKIYNELDGVNKEAFKQFCEELLPRVPFVDDDEASKIISESIKKMDGENFEKKLDELGKSLEKLKGLLK